MKSREKKWRACPSLYFPSKHNLKRGWVFGGADCRASPVSNKHLPVCGNLQRHHSGWETVVWVREGKSRVAHTSFSQHLQGLWCSPWTAYSPPWQHGWKASFILSSFTFLMPRLWHQKARLRPGGRTADSDIPFARGDSAKVVGDKQCRTGVQQTLHPERWWWTLHWWICRLTAIQDYTSSSLCCKSIDKVSYRSILSHLGGRNFPLARKFILCRIEQESKIFRESLQL